MKFGGTSVGTIDKINNVANIVEKQLNDKKLIVVLSAMSGVTNKMQEYIDEIESNEIIENDLILTSGEAVSVGLLSAILKKRNIKSIPLLGWQIPIITDSNHQKAKILNIDKVRIYKYLNDYDVLVVAGFQGIDIDGKITSLGRGGSDTTAVAVAAAVDADRCDIYTDVDGVYTTDPRQHKKAKKIKKIFYDEMLEMASLGSKVMQPTSVQDAKLNKIDIKVKSSFVSKSGTLITGSKKTFSNQIITGISSTKNDAKITIVGVKDRPGVAASIFRPLSKNLINVDMVVQNISQNGKETDLTFTIKSEDLKKTERLIKRNKSISYKKLSFDKDLSKVSIIGVGMITTPGITYRMFQALASKKINILVISTSEIKISVLISSKSVKKAVAVLHKEFKLD